MLSQLPVGMFTPNKKYRTWSVTNNSASLGNWREETDASLQPQVLGLEEGEE